MAKNTSLFLRIGEAKNLPAKDLSGTSDPYCIIKLDNEQVARTATVWKTLDPFWGEEYTLHLPSGFHVLDIYVYDEDTISGDDLIGKVTLMRKELRDAPKGLESWMKLTPVDKDGEVQGELHLELGRYKEGDKDIIRVHVLEARDLAIKDSTGSSDPYVKLTLMGEEKQTHVVRGSRYPRWNEVFEFEVPHSAEDDSLLQLTVWDWDRMASNDFMGQIQFQLCDLTSNVTFKQWFRLETWQHSAKGGEMDENNESDDIGSIRVRARLTEERILPSQYYLPLIEVLMDSVAPDKVVTKEEHKINRPTPLKMLQEVMTLDLLELANTLVKLFLGQGKIVAYLDAVCSQEIENTSNPNTLFRGNSLATKSVDQFMKIVGMPYLHETLGCVIDQVFEERKYVELDPGRLSAAKLRKHSLKHAPREEDLIEGSTETLLRYLGAIKQRIIDSVPRMPQIMRLVFKQIRQRIELKWPGPEHEDHKYVGISGFLFLRFLAPAILSPKLFSLKETHPGPKQSRTLTLLAKTVQSLGNLGLQIGAGKEQWLEPVHPFILDSVTSIKHFIDHIVNIEDNVVSFDIERRRSVFHPSVTIKQGHLLKRRWDRKKFLHSFTFKKRYFRLKYETLAYSNRPTDPVRNTIQVCQICAVERVDENAFSKPHMGQVLSRNLAGDLEILYFQAKDINDMYSWISSIRKSVLTNQNLLDMYHPGAFRGDKWTCCSKDSKDAEGCSRTHSRVTIGDWRDPLDPDAEAQTIYSQLYHGRDMLRQKYLETTEAVKETVQSIQSQNALATFLDIPESMHKSTSFEDAQIGSVAQLLDVVKDLEKVHEAFEKMEIEEQRGSFPGLDTKANNRDSNSKPVDQDS